MVYNSKLLFIFILTLKLIQSILYICFGYNIRLLDLTLYLDYFLNNNLYQVFLKHNLFHQDVYTLKI